MQISAGSIPMKNDLSGLKAILEAARIKNGVPGMSVAILYKGEVVFAEGLGKRNEHQPFTKEETIAPIQSLTKAFTATAIGQLVAEGKMDWSTTPVNMYLPEFELKDPVLTSQLNLDDLLSHRTPLSPELEITWYRSRESRRDLIKRLRHAEMPSKLSTTLNYSNIMYGVAGEAAANVAGTSYEQVVHDKIIEPLKLSNTGFSQSAMKKLPNHASPYYANSFEDAQKGEFQENEYDEIYMADSPAGDIHSNVLDLLRWGKCIMDGGKVNGEQVLDKKNIETTLTPHNINVWEKRTSEFAIAQNYGLGWALDTFKGHNYYCHGGAYPGSRAFLMIFPDDDLVIAHLANIQLTSLLYYSSLYIADMFLDLSFTQDWLFDDAVKETSDSYKMEDGERERRLPLQIKNRASVLPREELAGEFETPLFGRVTITTVKVPRCKGDRDEGGDGKKEESELVIQYNNYKSILEHYHFDSFKAVFTDLGETFAILVNYQTGSDGHVSGLTMDLNALELICFTKVKKPVE
ncbi:MAG: beta-lactamase/transpeptidase-like protein [Linnemannia gamsii]|nr:MAG: beta-lactamase/transpeptidase-like protein [Linnemannia gamsii]